MVLYHSTACEFLVSMFPLRLGFEAASESQPVRLRSEVTRSLRRCEEIASQYWTFVLSHTDLTSSSRRLGSKLILLIPVILLGKFFFLEDSPDCALF